MKKTWKYHVLYKCVCEWFETPRKGDMRRHLQRYGCIDEEDIDILCSTRKNRDLSHLDKEDRQDLWKKENREKDQIRACPGGRDENEFITDLFHGMKLHSKRRGHSEPEFTKDELLQFVKEKQVYRVKTDIGNIEIPLLLTNGYINSVSMDRICNDEGYTKDNVRVIPYFLNVEDEQFSKINPHDWKEIVILREQDRTAEELTKIINIIKSNKSTDFLSRLAQNAYHNSLRKGIEFDFVDYKELRRFLINKFIDQGGRCAYLGIPIYPIKNHKYKMSIERIDPTKGYERNNIALIVSSLNGRPIGRYNNKNISDEERQEAVNAGTLGFNIDNLDQWTLLTPERKKILEGFKEKERNIINRLINTEN